MYTHTETAPEDKGSVFGLSGDYYRLYKNRISLFVSNENGKRKIETLAFEPEGID